MLYVILYMYDKKNGHRYRKITYEYYECVKANKMIVSAWMVQ